MLLQDEEALSLWLKYIEEEPFTSVLELASGSGVMAGILKRKGYDITASDISEKMKEVSAKNYDGEYLILNMTDYHLNKKYDALKNHEMIHLRQAQDTGNSWYRFYWLYLWYSFMALWYIRKHRRAAYYLNPFEMEAYCHMYDLHYLESTGGKATEWRKFAKMSLAARLRYIRKNNIG